MNHDYQGDLPYMHVVQVIDILTESGHMNAVIAQFPGLFYNLANEWVALRLADLSVGWSAVMYIHNVLTEFDRTTDGILFFEEYRESAADKWDVWWNRQWTLHRGY